MVTDEREQTTLRELCSYNNNTHIFLTVVYHVVGLKKRAKNHILLFHFQFTQYFVLNTHNIMGRISEKIENHLNTFAYTETLKCE